MVFKSFERSMNALVTIIIPTYNRGEIINETLNSCLNQTYPELELIIIDDGSTDDTEGVVASISTTPGRTIRYIRQKNAGASAARNVGLHAAKGEFIQFLDSDDVLLPPKISKQVATLKQTAGTGLSSELSLCFGRFEEDQLVSRVGANLGTQPLPYIERLCSRTVHLIQTSAPLWRASFLLERRLLWDTELSLGDDLEFHVRCLSEATRIAFVNEELFVVKNHARQRLSDFSSDGERLSSLLTTREKIFHVLSARGIWNGRCSSNTQAFLMSMYPNVLRRLGDDQLTRFEVIAQASFLRPAVHMSPLIFFLYLRRSVGRSAVLALMSSLLSIRRHFSG